MFTMRQRAVVCVRKVCRVEPLVLRCMVYSKERSSVQDRTTRVPNLVAVYKFGQ